MIIRSLAFCCILSFLSIPLSAQDLPFSEDFSDPGLTGWTIVDDPEPQSPDPVTGTSKWFVENGVLVQSTNIWSYELEELETKYHLGTHIVAGNDKWTDYSFNALVRSTDNDGVGLIFRYNNPGNYYRILLMNDPAWSGRDSAGTEISTPLQRIQRFEDGEPIILAENLVTSAYPSGWFSLTADVRADTIRAYLDGKLIMAAVDTVLEYGKIGVLSYANQNAYYDSISVTQEFQVYPKDQRLATYPVREDRLPYIQNPTQTSVEIAFRTKSKAVGKVRYGSEKGVFDREILGEGAVKKHHFLLSELEPRQRYYYEVKTDETIFAPEESFRTAPTNDETRFSFLVLGDSGVGTDTQRRVADEMRSSMNEDEVDFVVHVGDVHQGNGSYYDDIYFKPYREIIKNVNVFTSVGNHDTYTDNAAPYLDDFYLPHNNAENTERYYSFRWGNAYFIALDTNINYAPGSPQYRFLLEALTDTLRESATWTFVYSHHPFESEYWTNWGGTPLVREHLVPLYEQYGVDMVMNGHTHSYERGQLNHVHYLVSGGGGGGLDEYAEDHAHIQFSEGKHHFTRVDVDGDKLYVKAVDQWGIEFDNFLVNKLSSVTTDPRGLLELPEKLEISSVFPNPASNQFHATYRIDRPSRVRIDLVDVLGRRVDVLVDKYQLQNTYDLRYNTDNIPAGNYILRLVTEKNSVSRNLTIAR